MSDTNCSTCGAAFPIHPAGYSGGTGYASHADGSKVCYSCADTEQRAELTTANVYGVYLSGDGKSLTTWTGGKLATVTHESDAKTGFYGSTIRSVRAVTPDGSHWYGKGRGRGMCLTVRRNKVR